MSTRLREVLGNCLVAGVAIVLCLIGAEVAVRLLTPDVGFAWRNFVTDPINLIRVMKAVKYDSELGFVLKPNAPTGDTNALGTRRVGFTTPPEKAVIIVGDSFTYGSQVNWPDSWPAQLYRMTGIPLINGGNGGYGVDQNVLYAERLAQKVKPTAFVLAIVAPDIDHTQMSVFSGAGKPYFSIGANGLTLRNVPVPRYSGSIETIGLVRSIFGYSYLAYWVADRLGLKDRWQLHQWGYQRVDPYGLQKSCLLMDRFAALAQRYGVKGYVVAEYGWNDFSHRVDGSLDRVDSRIVLDCAQAAGLTPIDTYPAFAAIFKTEHDYAKYYVGGVGHMTPLGNRIVAEIVAKYLSGKSPSAAVPGPSDRLHDGG